MSYQTLTNAGTVNNILTFGIIQGADELVTDNYEISFIYGELEVTPRPITIQTASDSKVYDGFALWNELYELFEGELAASDYIEVVGRTKIIHVGQIDNILTLLIKNELGVDVLDSYIIEFIYGTLEITPRYITVKPIDMEKVYDGTPLMSTEAEIIVGSLATTDHISIITSGSQTYVGSSLSYIFSLIIDNGIDDITFNYIISFEDGLLEVTPRPLTIVTASEQKEYDGIVLFNTVIEIKEGSMPLEHHFSIVGVTSIIEPGAIDNQLMIQINHLGIDVTSNFDLTIELGLLRITPRNITVSTPSDEKLYDGTPLFNHAWELTKGSLISGHHLEVVVTGSITNYGKTFNYYDYQILDESLNDVSSYYIVKPNLGILEILRDKIFLNLISESDSKTYDGTPLTNTGWKILEGKVAANHTLMVEVTGSITEVGAVYNTYNVVIIDEYGQDVTDTHYSIETKYGILAIFDETGNGDNDLDDFSIKPSGSPESDQGMIITLFKIYSEISDMLYLRDKSYGDYTKTGFTRPPVFVSPFDMSPLNFTNLAINGALQAYQIQIQIIVPGQSYYLPYFATNGYYNNINDVYLSHEYGTGYTVNYTPIGSVNYADYSLINTAYSDQESIYRQFVYQSYLNLPSDTRTKLLEIAARNGLSNQKATVIQDVQNYIRSAALYNMNFKPIPSNADYALYFLEQSREGICQHFAMAATVMYRALGIPARYVVGVSIETKANDWVNVTPMQGHAWVEIYIEGLGWIPIEVTPGGSGGLGSGISGGSGAGSGAGEGAGEGSGSGEGEGTGAGSGSGLGDGKGTCPDGQTCQELPLIDITSGNGSKTYDGTPLTNPDYSVDGTLFAGHRLVVEVTGSITQVGEERNVFTVVILDEEDNDVSNEYRIRTQFGLLVIVPDNDKPILEIQVYDIKKIYNGQLISITNQDYWIPSNNLPETYRVSLEIVGSITNAGKIESYINRGTLRILNENNIDVTSEYNVVFYYGSITVLERPITVASYSAQKYYDGTPLTNHNYYLAKGTLVSGNLMTVSITGTITEVGMEINTISTIIIVNSSGIDVTENYKITKLQGLLVIKD
jgi:hypothetical protein